jgi:hypothetical protein
VANKIKGIILCALLLSPLSSFGLTTNGFITWGACAVVANKRIQYGYNAMEALKKQLCKDGHSEHCDGITWKEWAAYIAAQNLMFNAGCLGLGFVSNFVWG